MVINTGKLIRVSTYATKIKKSQAWVRHLIKTGLPSVKVDGITYIILK